MEEPVHPSRQEIDAGQLRSLRTLISKIGEQNTFYAPKLREAGLSEPLDNLDSFSAGMPFTHKSELAADQAANPPYGTNLTYPRERYIRVHQTSSSTGEPLRWLDTPESWDWMIRSWLQVFGAVDAQRHDVVFAAFSFGPFIGFWLAFEAAMRIGCLCIPGGAMNSATRLRAILSNNVTLLCCTPTYAIRLGEVAREEGIDLSRSCVRAIIVAGEPGGSLPAIRDRIESLWPGAKVADHHGMTEVGPVTFECPARPGVLHIIEEAYLAEVIEQETTMRVEAGSGQIGELVLTTLGRLGSPLLRYRTGDLVKPGESGMCPCGRATMTLEGGILGRADDMVVVRGVNLFPSAVDQIINTQAGVAEYRVLIDQTGSMTELRVQIEAAAEIGDASGLQDRLERAFRDTYSLRVPIEVCESGTLPRFELKARRWIKLGPER